MYILNSKLYNTDEKTISPLSESFMFGYGLFETLKVSNGKIVFLKEHIDRLIKGCKTINLSLEFSGEDIENDLYKLIEKNQISDGVLKVLYAKNKENYYLLLTTRSNPYTKEYYDKGFKVMFSDIKRNKHSILSYVKSNNYMENLLAKQQASQKGFDEVIFLNTDDDIAEGSVSNFFWIKDGEVFTPHTECGLLAGIVREKVILVSNNLGLKINVGKFKKQEILDADEVFITNSIMDIMPVSKIEEKDYNMSENSITKEIIKSYKALVGEYNEN